MEFDPACAAEGGPDVAIPPPRDGATGAQRLPDYDLLASSPKGGPGGAAGSFAEATHLAILAADECGRVTFWNRAAEALFGHCRSDIIGQPLELIIPERFRAAHRTGMARVDAASASASPNRTVEVTALRKDGSEFPVELSISVWQGASGLAFGAHVVDISARRAREAELQRLALHDELTGLLNPGGFRRSVERQLAERGRAIVFALDLDCFKGVNDSLGHAVGDALLQTIAVRMNTCAGAGSVLARLGGDEFGLLLPPDSDLFNASTVAAGFIDAFKDTFLVAGHQLHVGVSIGIACAPDHAGDAEELLARADLAMFRAKKDGGRAYRLFDATMGSQLAARRAFKDELLQAHVQRQWELYYQPQVRLSDGALIGVEALLRWRHPQWGVLFPSVFMPVLETHLVAFEVGNWILDEACRQLAEWRVRGLGVPRMSVNLFSAQVHAGSISSIVDRTLASHGLIAKDLELELTEKIALRHDDAALAPLVDLRSRGVGIAFDDFGTGYASLSTLQRFPLTRLKIDRSFVQDICTNAHSEAAVRGILAIGGSLGIEVVAEGIEDVGQRDRLIALGCEQGQGFLYGKGVPACELHEYADAGRRRTAIGLTG